MEEARRRNIAAPLPGLRPGESQSHPSNNNILQRKALGLRVPQSLGLIVRENHARLLAGDDLT